MYDLFSILIYLATFIAVPTMIGLWIWRTIRARKAKTWPTTEATIQSGNTEHVGNADGIEIKLPVFNFTYLINGENHYGRFSLQPYITDPGPGLFPRMIDRKLQIRYNPAKPEEWFIADEYIEGCRVGQKLSPHFIDYPPL